MNWPRVNSLKHQHGKCGTKFVLASDNHSFLIMKQDFRLRALILSTLLFSVPLLTFAQIDPMHRNLLELGYDQPIVGQGPQAVYAYYYYNNPEFIKTNMALRLALAPAYLYSELGFKQLLSPYTDIGIGLYGGAFGDNYFEVRQGYYYKNESFYGDGGGTALSIYQLLNPGMRIPLNLVARAGLIYSVYDDTSHTSPAFTLPENRVTGFIRTGLRFAGKEPVLYPDLGLELSVWFERQWRTGLAPYGFSGDREVSAASSLYWVYAGLNYSWTNVGCKISFAVTAGGSSSADRFSAWRLGGVLPLVSEFPLVLPGYYYEELTAENFLHLYFRYSVPLDRPHRFELMFEAASARLNYLPGFEQPGPWQTGAGVGLAFTPKNQMCRIVIRYGYGFNAIRGGEQGAQSIGLLVQLDFEAWKKHKRSRSDQ